jgi:hypothetical protein
MFIVLLYTASIFTHHITTQYTAVKCVIFSHILEKDHSFYIHIPQPIFMKQFFGFNPIYVLTLALIISKAFSAEYIFGIWMTKIF